MIESQVDVLVVYAFGRFPAGACVECRLRSPIGHIELMREGSVPQAERGGGIELLVLHSKRAERPAVEAGGRRYPHLEPDEVERRRLDEILAPLMGTGGEASR